MSEVGAPPPTALELVRQLFVDAAAADCLRSVWNIVSAMRGPDSNIAGVSQEELKSLYTTPIRQRVLTGEMARHLAVSSLETYSDNPDDNTFNDTMEHNWDHYKVHICTAQRAIRESFVIISERNKSPLPAANEGPTA